MWFVLHRSLGGGGAGELDRSGGIEFRLDAGKARPGHTAALVVTALGDAAAARIADRAADLGRVCPIYEVTAYSRWELPEPYELGSYDVTHLPVRPETAERLRQAGAAHGFRVVFA